MVKPLKSIIYFLHLVDSEAVERLSCYSLSYVSLHYFACYLKTYIWYAYRLMDL